MSTRSELLAAFGPRVQIQDETPVLDGSVERLGLRTIPGRELRTVGAARSLMRRQLPPKLAHAAMNELVDRGETYVEVPRVESLPALVAELETAGIVARLHTPAERRAEMVRERGASGAVVRTV